MVHVFHYMVTHFTELVYTAKTYYKSVQIFVIISMSKVMLMVKIAHISRCHMKIKCRFAQQGY